MLKKIQISIVINEVLLEPECIKQKNNIDEEKHVRMFFILLV